MESDETSDPVKPRPLRSFGDFSSVRVSCAGVGAAASLGSLSVPPGWPMANQETEPVLPSLPATDVNTAFPVAAGRPPGLTFREALMGMVTGRHAVAHHAEQQTGAS